MPMRMLALVVMAGACSAPETSVITSESHCPNNLCNNSNDLSFGGIYEANLEGEEDTHGFRLDIDKRTRAQIVKDGVSYDLHVVDSRVVGLLAGYPKLEGAQLVDAEIAFLHEDKPAFAIHFDAVRTGNMPLGQPGTLEAYRISLRSLGMPITNDDNLCNDPGYGLDGEGHLYGLQPGEVVIFAGERFDLANLLVATEPAPSWINFGCASHTFSKMFLLRETYASNPQRDWASAQATFNMLVGRYCGGSTTLTIPGVPLLWIGGAIDEYLIDKPPSIEARWNEFGATCVGTPRLEFTPSVPALEWFPDIRDAIKTACGGTPPPACSDDIYAFEGALRVSANWKP